MEENSVQGNFREANDRRMAQMRLQKRDNSYSLPVDNIFDR